MVFNQSRLLVIDTNEVIRLDVDDIEYTLLKYLGNQVKSMHVINSTYALYYNNKKCDNTTPRYINNKKFYSTVILCNIINGNLRGLTFSESAKLAQRFGMTAFTW